MGIAAYILSYGSALLGIAIVAAYLYTSRKYNHWSKKGIKYIKPFPFVGSLKDVVLLKKNIGMMAKDIYLECRKEPYIGFYAFDEPVLQIHDLDLVKAVLVKDFQVFCDRSITASEKVDPLLARSLFGLRGDRWRHSRNAITPSFTSGKMKRMYELVSECGKILVTTIEKEKCIGKPVPLYELACRYTTDVIASCAFGIQGNTLADPKAEFRQTLRKHFEFSPKRALAFVAAFLSPKLLEMLGMELVLPVVEDFIINTINTTIKEREKHNIKRNDLLDSLIQLKSSGSISDTEEDQSTQPLKKFVMDEEGICAHSFAFLVAGFETSAAAMTYMLYELAMNNDVQEKLRKEIKGATTDGLSYETVHEMKYLDMVMRETLRKYPPLPFLDRVSVKEYTIPGTNLTLEEGTRIIIPHFGIHMDPELHPNPKKFDPDRFSEENKKKIVNYSHMPFGEGPRKCVGVRLAQMQTKCAIAQLIMRYSVHPCSKTPEEIKFNTLTFLLEPQDNIELVLKPLSEQES